MQNWIDEAYALGCEAAGSGEVASYIPELAKADPRKFGLAVHTIAGDSYAAGDADLPFTLQSISKVLALACVQAAGVDPFQHMFCEPSGDAFHSIVKLEEEKGKPRNPLINAGAIMVSGLLTGRSAEEKITGFQAFLERCASETGFNVDQAVYESECRTGFRNRALANYMKHFGVIDNPDTAVDSYFRQCAVQVNAKRLARMALFLANDGKDPLSGETILEPAVNRQMLATMTICGLYDEVGRFALRVGLPAKSGVSGGILAVAPGKMAIAAYGPALGPRGNSVASMAALEYLSNALNLSVFSASSL